MIDTQTARIRPKTGHKARDMAQDLTKALNDHCLWKRELRAAAVYQKRDLPISRICRDDCCAFGRWLHQLPPSVRHSAEAQTVERLHAQFHRAAGAVAEMIVDGHYDQALSSLATGGYPQVSAELTRAVVQWKMKVLVEAA